MADIVFWRRGGLEPRPSIRKNRVFCATARFKRRKTVVGPLVAFLYSVFFCVCAAKFFLRTYFFFRSPIWDFFWSLPGGLLIYLTAQDPGP